MASSSRDQAVQLLNDAKLASEPTEKVRGLRGGDVLRCAYMFLCSGAVMHR